MFEIRALAHATPGEGVFPGSWESPLVVSSPGEVVRGLSGLFYKVLISFMEMVSALMTQSPPWGLSS